MKFRKAKYNAQHTFCTALLTGTLVTAGLFFNSCRKEKPLAAADSVEKPKLSTMMDVSGLSDDQMDAVITQFYNDVKKLQQPAATSTVNITLNDAVFRTEGAYNKYVVQHQDSGSMYLDTFSVNLTANRDGSVNTKEAANAFWLIKDQLMQRVQTIGDPAYKLEAFDIEALSTRDGNPQLVNGHYTLTIGVVLGNGGSPVPIQSPWFTTAVDHVYIAGSSYNAPQYYQSVTKGQGTINYNGGPNGQHAIVYNINNDLPGGAEMLRERGMPYYRSIYEPATGYGYWANITQVDAGAMGTATSNCDYVTRQIPGYTNVTMWNMNAPYDNDFYKAYHAWLNTAMMNFYLNYIPQYLHGVIPSGKKLYDLQIGLEDIGGLPGGYYRNIHHYFVSYGNFIRINNGPGTKFNIEDL